MKIEESKINNKELFQKWIKNKKSSFKNSNIMSPKNFDSIRNSITQKTLQPPVMKVSL